MKTRPTALLCILSFTAACASARLDPRPASALPPAITERGESVYVGRVYSLDAPSDSPTYVYERRVATRPDAVVSTHVTRDLAGHIQLAESAIHSPDYRLSEYTLHANQFGQTGDVRVQGDQVVLRVRDHGQERTKTERREADVVVGPTLVGHIMRHLPELATGRKRAVSMAVVDRLETIGFMLEEAPPEQADQVRIKMTASNLLYRLAMSPIYFTFERATQKLVRLEGRVPPKVLRDGKVHDFDARVEYEFAMATYR